MLKKNWIALRIECNVYKNEVLELSKTTRKMFETDNYKEALNYYENKVSRNGTTNESELTHLVGIKIYKLIVLQEKKLLFNKKQRKFKTMYYKYYW